MGLCFYYSGRFNPAVSISEMISEIEEVARANDWKYFIFEREFPQGGFTTDYDQNIYGICFTPPECETVHFEFLSNGRMSNFFALENFGNSDDSLDREILYYNGVKTQYAGPEIHMKLIKLFKYISQKYLLDFDLYDEGEYWKTEDESILRKNFSRNQFFIDGIKAAFDKIPKGEDETPEDYVKRVIETWTKEQG